VSELWQNIRVTKKKTSSLCQEHAKMFVRSGAKPDDIINTGEIAMVCLQSGKTGQKHHCSRRWKISERKFIPIIGETGQGIIALSGGKSAKQSSYLSFQIFSLLSKKSWKLFDEPLPLDVLARKNGLVCSLDFSG